MDHIELAYLAVEVTDVAGTETVLRDIAGLVPGDPIPGAASTWRDDDRAHRLILMEGPVDDAAYVGFAVPDAAALDAAAARLAALGCAVEHGDAPACAARRVEGMVRTTAPWGTPVEVVHGLAPAGTPFASALVPGGFKTGALGFGHCVFAPGPGPDLEAAHRFVTEGLGLRRTDWLDLPIGPGLTLDVRFYHGNPRHHSLALAGAPAPKKLHHVMVETNAIDDVGAAFDRAFAAGVPIANGLGKHDNDRMFSFYVATPAGFQVEVGHGAREVGPDWDDDHAYDRISLWGHQPVAR
jgi:2,3-dihydroxybiphenyl 1,2-dioxygenase